MHKKIITFVFITGFILLCAGCSDAQQQSARMTGLMKGQRAPDFTLKALDGKQFSLSSLRGKNPVCLVFWATWCPYCIKEIPKLKSINAKYNGKGLQIISINIAVNDPLRRVMAFQEKNRLPYPILYDKEGITSRLYGVTGVPVSVVIDREGIIQYRGYALPDNVEYLFDRLI